MVRSTAPTVRSIDHYLDDFILIGPPESNACSEALSVLEEECAQLANE